MSKEKIIVAIIAIIVLVGAIFTAIVIRKESNQKEVDIQKNRIILNEEVSDECTDEYEMSLSEETEQVNSGTEEKVSANSKLILKKYYTECEHTINEYVEMPKELINMTEKEIKEEYPEWEVIGFSPNEVILYKEFSEQCKEHFIMKIENGKIVVYKIADSGELEAYLKTEIGTEYLTDTDIINLQDGLEIYGKEELNKILEDFE